jgi:hypothetical protein
MRQRSVLRGVAMKDGFTTSKMRKSCNGVPSSHFDEGAGGLT